MELIKFFKTLKDVKDRHTLYCDLLIIGAGFAGMVAAARASTLGLNTVQVGNSSGLFLASGMVDLLGVYPIGSRCIRHDPQNMFQQLQADIPEHPYSKTSYEKILECLDFLRNYLKYAGLEYHPYSNENFSVLTSVGTVKPTFLVPATFSKWCRKGKNTRLLLVDFPGFNGFSAKQIANAVQKTGIECFTMSIDIPGITRGFNPTQLAHLFEDRQFQEYISQKVASTAYRIDLVGIPAVCGIDNSLEIMHNLEKMTGLGFFEIPGLPPSIPGLRLKKAFEKRLSENNVTFLSNAKIESCAVEKEDFILEAISLNHTTRIVCKGVILATGRFPGGGLHAQRDMIREIVFNLPVYQPEHRNMWHRLNFFDKSGHCINTAGVETDRFYRPVNTDKKPLFENLYAAGTILAHNDWVRLKSGSGVSCVTACTAVEHFHSKRIGGC